MPKKSKNINIIPKPRTEEERRKLMMSTAGAFKGTEMGSDEFWAEILNRRPTNEPPVTFKRRKK